MTTVDVSVDWPELRRALLAVVPHAGADKEFVRLTRVRLYVAPGQVVVAASNGRSAVLASAVTVEHHAPELTCVDLSPADAKEIAAAFKAGKGGLAVVRLAADGQFITVTDVSGLFPGKSLKLPAYPVDESFPDLTRVIGPLIRGATFAEEQARSRADSVRWLVTNDAALQPFVRSAKVYGEVMAVEPVGRSMTLVITIGSSFIGLLMPMWFPPEQDENFGKCRLEWLPAFEQVSAVHPIPAAPVDPDESPDSDERVPDVAVLSLDAADLERLVCGDPDPDAEADADAEDPEADQ